MSDAQTTGTQPYNQGQVSLPADGQVLSADMPDASQSDSQTTPSQTPAQTSTQTSPQGAQPGQTSNDVPTNADQNQNPDNGPQTQDTQRTTNIANKQPQSGPTTASTAPPVHPTVQKAGLLHTIAQTLAGGPRYTEKVDPNTGDMVRTQVPLSRGDIGMAIAMTAISGALSGLAVPSGPNATGRAAQAGFEAATKQRNEADAQQQQQATDAYQRKAQIAETNMRMYNNARQIGQQDQQTNEDYIGQYKDLADRLQKDYPGYIKGIVGYKDLAKYNVTSENAIPYSSVPRLDQEGKQVTNDQGVPQWDINYMIVDPSLKSSGLLSADDIKTGQKYGFSGFNNKLLGNSPMNMSMALNYRSQLSGMRLAEGSVQNFYDTINSSAKQPQFSVTSPEIKDADLNAQLEAAATKYGVNPAFVKGIALKESSGNPNVQNSSKGAIGPMQLMPDTAKSLGIDPTDMAQNVDGGVRYFASLMQKFNGDPKLALAAYNAGPGAIKNGQVPNFPETQDYVSSILKNVGFNDQKGTVDDSGQQKPIDLAAAVTADPTLKTALPKFQAMLNKTEGNYSKAISALQNGGDSDTANKITALFGGTANIQKYDMLRTLQLKQAESDIAENRSETASKNKTARDLQVANSMQETLQTPANYKFTDDMLDKDSSGLKDQLTSQGVKVPSNFDSLYSVAHYKTPLTSYAARVWAKGAPAEMDQQTAVSYINKFINPDFDDTKYGAIKNARKDLYSDASPAGKTIIAAGTAANHLNLLRNANVALQNGDVLALNHIANTMGVETGKTPVNTFNAIADTAADEVSKTVMGGGAPYKEQIISNRAKLNPDNSPQQNEAAIDALTGLMAGRMKELDNWAATNAQEHIKPSPDVTALFQKYGYDTPWVPGTKPTGKTPPANTPATLPGQRPQEVPVIVNGQVQGFTMPGKTGMRKVTPFAQPTGQ